MKKLLKILTVVLVVSMLALTLVACADPCKNGHTWDKGTVEKEATCTTTGTITYKCLKCDETKQETIPATAHTPKDVSVAPTCTEAGITGATKCEVCGTEISAGTPVPALGHNYNGQEWKVEGNKHYQECKNGCSEHNEHNADLGEWEAKEGKHVRSCTETGCSVSESHNPDMGAWKHDDNGNYRECATCGLKEYEAAHNYEGQAWLVDTETGMHYQECKNGCGARNEHAIVLGDWHEVDGNHVRACTVDGCTISEQHTPSMNWVNTDETNHYKQCATCNLQSDNGAHNPTANKIDGDENQHAVTCICGKTYPNADHDWTLDATASTAPTCTDKGENVYACACGATKSEEIAELGHKEVVDAAVPATCTATGLTEGKHCSTCNAVLVKQEIVSMIAHTEVVDAAVPATCTATGLTEGKHCSVCNTVLVAQEEVPMIAHSWNAGEVTTPANCTEAGVKTYTCSVCGATNEETIPATGHDYEGQPWQVDEAQNKHYQVCKNCDVHNWHDSALGAWALVEGTHVRTCSAEGCTISESHAPAMSDAWKKDTDGYYKDCATCGFKQYEGAHDYEGQPWITTVLTHYQECKNGCGEHSTDENHVFTANVCDTCGYAIAQEDIITNLDELISSYGTSTFVLTGVYGKPTTTDQHRLLDDKGNSIIICYKLKDASLLVEGDTISVTGSLTKYNSIKEFAAGCTYTLDKKVEYAVETTYNSDQVTVEGLLEKYERDTEVTFTITANEGFRLDSVVLNDLALTPDESGSYKFTVSAQNVLVINSNKLSGLPAHNDPKTTESKSISITNSVAPSSYGNGIFEVSGIKFNYYQIMKNTNGLQINSTKNSVFSNAVISGKNITSQANNPFAGAITKIVLEYYSGTNDSHTLTVKVANNPEFTNAETFIFSKTKTSHDFTKVTDGVYVSFEATGSGAAYITSLTITYSVAGPCANSQDPTHVDAKAATCTEDGNKEHWVCSDCNKVFVKDEQGAYVEVAADSVVIKATHTPATELTSGTADGKHSHWYVCTVCGEKLDITECTPITVLGTAATCTKDGLSDGTKCSVCDQIITEQTVIPALGHDYKYTANGDGTHNGICLRNCGEDGATVENVACASAEDALWQIDENNHWKLCALCGGVVEQSAHDGNDTCACGAIKPTYTVVDADSEAEITSHDIVVTMPAYAAIGSEITITITSQRFEVIMVACGDSSMLESQGDNLYKGVLETGVITISATELTGVPTYTGVEVTGASADDVYATITLNGTELAEGAELAEGNEINISILYMIDDYDISVVVTQGSNSQTVALGAYDDNEGTSAGTYTCLALGDVSIKVVARTKVTVTIPTVSNATISVGKVVDDGDPVVVNNGDTVLVGDKLAIEVKADDGYKATYTTAGLDEQGIVTGSVTITVTIKKIVTIQIDSNTGADIELIVDPEGEIEISENTALTIMATVKDGITDKIIGAVTVNGDSTDVTDNKDGTYSYTIAYDSIAAGAILKVSATLADKPADPKWTLVTSIDMIDVGSQVVFACNSEGKVAGDVSSQYMLNKSATFSSDKKTIETLPSDAVILTLAKSGSNWTFANAGGQLLGVTAVKKLAWGSGTTTWTISISSDGTATVKSTTSSYGTMKYNTSAPRFTTYASGQAAIQLYVLQ